ncbi:hypothetical protein GCM10023074_15610 [Microbispora amethystogenes]|uniref:Uncharacterized protein n=1 Tax=Microbispora amethystogenes TaxID=1427754 RepID=A0ABQ4F7D7_9ACTN|nr:hypothetical protein Mam01_08800 [Microbispora amethystogenes]
MIFALNLGVRDDNVHRPAPSVPVVVNSETEGLVTSTLVDCQSDHGPFTPVVVTPRTRHRTTQPSVNLPDGMDTDAYFVSRFVAVVPVPDQINPDP